MGSLGSLGLRVQAELSARHVLVLALAINVVADYVSLLETRLLLGHMHRFRSCSPKPACSSSTSSRSRPHRSSGSRSLPTSTARSTQGEIETFAEILGLFSIFSVLFYSTFLTSVWTWAYILSTWLDARLHPPPPRPFGSTSRTSPSRSSAYASASSSSSALHGAAARCAETRTA
jgi:hypothetical protein